MSTIEEKRAKIEQLYSITDTKNKEIEALIDEIDEITKEIQKDCGHKWKWSEVDCIFFKRGSYYCPECHKHATPEEYPELYANAPKPKLKFPMW